MISSQGNSNPSLSSHPSYSFPRSRLRKTLQSVAFYGSLCTVIATALTWGDVNSPYEMLFVSLFFLLPAIRIADSMLGNGLVFADRRLVAPLLGLLLFAVFQTLPLSAIGLSGVTRGSTTFLSLNRYETVDFILLLGSLILLGDTLLHLTKSEGRLKAIAACVIVVGIGSALFGIYRQEFISDTGLRESNVLLTPYAQFLNRNHFALLMEMTLGLLLGLALKARLSTALKIAFWMMIALCWYVIISANSRGGIISAAGMIVLAAFMHFVTRGSGYESAERERRRSPARILRPIVVTAVLSTLLLAILTISVAFIGGDTVVSRFENTNREFNPLDDGGASRAEIWEATMRVIRAYPIAGAGFGAFPQAVTEFDTYSNGKQRVLQAHNEYLEIAAAGGAIAVILAAVFLWIFLRTAYKRYQARGKLERAICFGAVTGISGVLLHSVVDFGLHVYVNAVVFVLLIVMASANVKDVEET